MSNTPAAAKRGIPSKADFKEWYPFIVEAAELVDKRYPIKGMDVWRPYGWKTMRLIDDLTHQPSKLLLSSGCALKESKPPPSQIFKSGSLQSPIHTSKTQTLFSKLGSSSVLFSTAP